MDERVSVSNYKGFALLELQYCLAKTTTQLSSVSQGKSHSCLIHEGPAKVIPGQAQTNTLDRTVHIQKCFSKVIQNTQSYPQEQGLMLRGIQARNGEPTGGVPLEGYLNSYRCSEQGSSHQKWCSGLLLHSPA